MKQLDKKYAEEDNLLVNDLRSIVSKARSKAFAAVNYSLVERNWRIGQRIVEQEQNGASRAEYGKHVIEVASAALTEEFGKGFSYTNIANYKRFYLTFNDLQILQTVSEEFKKQKDQTVSDKLALTNQKRQAVSAQSELRLLMSKKKGPDDNPTIGIILCAETDSDVARYSTLAKNDQMFAAKYKLYLPDKEDLRREIEKQKELYLMAHPEGNV